VNLIQRIDHWAAAAPEAIAHLGGDKTLTYGELRRRSDRLASYLTNRFGDDRRPIAVLGHSEPEMLIAFLGAVKSGRPYLPIDTALPQTRIDQIAATSHAALSLTPDQIQRFSTDELPGPTMPVEKNNPFLHLAHERKHRRTQRRDHHARLPRTFH
jgi:non-ribosomal peptide synthetase component F